METIVKFSAYRLALKLRKIQKKLCLDLLDNASAVVCFNCHGLSAEKHDLTICVPEMVTIPTSIYETLYHCEPEIHHCQCLCGPCSQVGPECVGQPEAGLHRGTKLQAGAGVAVQRSFAGEILRDDQAGSSRRNCQA